MNGTASTTVKPVTRRNAYRFTPGGSGAAMVLAILVFGACSGGYAGRTSLFRQSLDEGQVEGAFEHVDRLIREAEERSAGSGRVDSDYPLLLLERAAMDQALMDHRQAISDYGQADQLMEILDLTPRGAEAVGRYLWSDDTGPYRPPLYEKLMINVSALASYLAMNDLSGARVEARRLTVLTEYFENSGFFGHPMMGAAHYLCGLTMELSGDRMEALRYYMDAMATSDAPGLAEAILRLSPGTVLEDRTEVAQARERIGTKPDGEPGMAQQVEVVALIFTGLAPRREAERYPLGTVLGWMDGSKSYVLTPYHRSVLHRLEAEDLLTWINYPVLLARLHTFSGFDVSLGDQTGSARLLVDVESFALAHWAEQQPGIAFAAITRAITRVLAREAIQAAGSDSDGAQIAGMILQATMQMADTPDTRSWATMPAQIWIARLPVEPGRQTAVITARGPGVTQTQSIEIDASSGRSAVVTVRFFD